MGVVLDPQNLSNPDGYSAMTSFRSTATTDYTFFAPSDGVTGTLYTSATLLVKGAAAESTFDESYENTVKQVTDRIDGTVKTDRQKARRQELLDAGQQEDRRRACGSRQEVRGRAVANRRESAAIQPAGRPDCQHAGGRGGCGSCDKRRERRCGGGRRCNYPPT